MVEPVAHAKAWVIPRGAYFNPLRQSHIQKDLSNHFAYGQLLFLNFAKHLLDLTLDFGFG